MTVNLAYNFGAVVTEGLAVGVDAAPEPNIMHRTFDDAGNLNATSTPPATKSVVKVISLVGGAATVDLTTITGTNAAVQDGTGLKVRFWRVKPIDGNSMIFAEGAANGYALFGAAWSHTVYADCNWMEELKDHAPVISPTDRTIDVTGTGTERFELTLVMG